MTDLSAFTNLESVGALWDCHEAVWPSASPLPPSLRQLQLSGSPTAVLDGTALLVGFRGSLTARGFATLSLPASSRPLQVDWAPGDGIGNSTAINDASLQLGGRADRLFLRLPAQYTTDSGTPGDGPAVVHLGGCWLGQAALVVIDLRTAGAGAADASAARPAAPASHRRDKCNSHPAASQLRLAFPGSRLADLFTGALGTAAAAGLRRVEVLCGPTAQRFDDAAVRLMACASGGAVAAEFTVRDLLRLPAAQRVGWRLTLVAEPWRVVLARELEM